MINSTIVALSTAIGKGAIAIIRLSGENVLDIIRHFLPFQHLDSHKVYHSKLDYQNHTIDDVIFVYFKAPKTYTGEDLVEIHCHNNLFIINKILDIAQKCGAKLAKPGEFTERAFLNGKLDLSQAEAVLDVIHAESEFAENIAQKQLAGGLKHNVEFFRNELLDLLSELEVILDHEDILEFNRQAFTNKILKSYDDLKHKIAIGNRVEKFCNGLNIAIVGRPNVGKSSILNAILEKEKSIVSELAGTTRDAVEAVIEHKGIKINLIDTAGLKHASEFSEDAHSKIEQIGIKKTKEFIEQADYILLVVDLENFDKLQDIPKSKNLILVGNKLDKQKIDILKYLTFDALAHICVSAKTGENITKLLDLCIQDYLQNREIQESKFVINLRHKKVFEDVLTSINSSIILLQNDEELEIIAIEIRRAIELLATILGIDVSEAVLDKIFSNFCIGK